MIAVDTSTWIAFLEGTTGHEIPLLTRDRDFRHFARLAGLQFVEV